MAPRGNEDWGQPPPVRVRRRTSADSSVGDEYDYVPASGATGASGASAASASGPASAAAGSGKVKRQRMESEFSGAGEDEASRPLAITCAPCRSRKIKCDSRKPVCDNCLKSPAECYYPIKMKPGLRPGTGGDMSRRLEMLEQRVHTYEARLAEQEQRLQNLSQWHATSQPTPMLALPTAQALVGHSGDPSMSTTAASASAFSALDAPPGFENPSTGFSNPPTGFSNPLDMDALTGPLSGQGPGPSSAPGLDLSSFGPSTSPSGLSNTSFVDPRVLPPDDVVKDLIRLFFTHIHPWAPILSPTPMQMTYHAPWNIVVHAIVVVTLRLSTDPRIGVGAQREHIKRAAKTHVLAHAIESTSIASVQALALLALDLIGSEQGPSSWGILALLTRSAVHLGLTTEDDNRPSHPNASGYATPYFSNRPPVPSLSRTSIIPPAADWHQDEERRRLFWLIFSLDRYCCVSTGWDFALPDFEIRRRLPCADEIWAQPDWFQAPVFHPIPHLLANPTASDLAHRSPLAYLVEALDLLGRAHTLQSQEIDPSDSRAVERRKDASVTLSSAARRWFGDIPLRGERTAMALVVQALYHATLLKLNAYYAFPALSSGHPEEPFASTCITSARSVVALTGLARELGWTSSSSPLFVWSEWVAARVLFVHAFLTHCNGPDEDFDMLVSALREQAVYWSLANQYVKLLDRAKRKWLSSTTPSMEANPNLPEAIRSLLDLRRTAYTAVGANGEATPFVSPPDMGLSHLPAWAVQPLLGDLHSWFDLPAGLFGSDV